MTDARTAFAPATVANIAVGFDLLGFAVDVVGDHVTVSRGEPGVRVVDITGPGADVIPRDPAKNTATVGLLRLCDDRQLDYGFDVRIAKGIPLGSGMGGSASSSVGAIVAANALLDEPLSKEDTLRYALLGEAAASGAPHPDNAAPCLYGGLTLAVAGGDHTHPTADVTELPFPKDLKVVLVNPAVRIDTRDARAVLPPAYPLRDIVTQTANLSQFLVACYERDAERLLRATRDVLIEPHRKTLIPGFEAARKAAFEAGARAFSISGSGPTIFALTRGGDAANAVCGAVCQAFHDAGVRFDAWVTDIGAPGARIVENS